jgi:1,4-alpha-glucan branching enzyme
MTRARCADRTPHHDGDDGMLSDADVDALVGARHADPFGVLGLHRAGDGRLWLRAMLPGARAVAVHEAGKAGRLVTTLDLRHRAGLWEGAIPRRKNRFEYRLHAQWIDGHSSLLADAYAFGTLIADDDLHFLGEGTHLRPFEVLGAHRFTLGEGDRSVAGVRFAVWAPNARRVSVVGSFNGWDGRRHPMRHRGGGGVWELFVPHAAVGDPYKFELLGPDGTLLPLKADPYARAAELRPATASVVAPLLPKRPMPSDRAERNRRQAPIAIYELHPGSWRRAGDGGFLDWDQLARQVPDYVAGLGFTHVELLPVSEHPFDGSWGYQTLGLFAPTARFSPRAADGSRVGSPEGFVRFVEACHDAGLGVLVDWVPAHFPADDHGLARFDGTPLYEYADPREGFHRDWNTLIYNFARHEVRNFLLGSALYWVERLGVDGLRVDAVASMLYRDYSRPAGAWVPNAHGGRENLEAISLLQQLNAVLGLHCPGAITLAEESTAFPGVSAPASAGGLGFHYKWNMGWMHDTLKYMREDPVHRRWHHDRMTFGLLYAFSENFVLPLSHDEVVHGKGSILGRMPGDRWQRFANLRAYYGFMWGHPGKKLLFMGQEFAQDSEWNHESGLPWALLGDPSHAGVQHLVRDLNRLYRERPALHRLDCEAAGFEWLAAHEAETSVYAWLRRDGGGDCALVACNFTPVPRQDLRLALPDAAPARWREALNTDSAFYGGSNLGNGDRLIEAEPHPHLGCKRSIRFTLPPLATVVLVPA